MFGWFKKKAKVVNKVSFTTEPVTTGFGSHKDLVDKLLGAKDGITHEKMNAVAQLYFNTTIEKALYKLKDGGAYGLVFAIRDVGFTVDDNKQLSDIVITFTDVGLLSSMTIKMSIKEVNEFLVPIRFHANKRKKEGV